MYTKAQKANYHRLRRYNRIPIKLSDAEIAPIVGCKLDGTSLLVERARYGWLANKDVLREQSTMLFPNSNFQPGITRLYYIEVKHYVDQCIEYLKKK